MATHHSATIDDLYREDCKAELVNGEIVRMSPAGTKVVWDVKLRTGEVGVYRAADPENPTVYRRGEVAEAEPAVPGWTRPVDELFE